MPTVTADVLDELVRASALLTEANSVTRLIATMVEQANDITRSELAAFYLRTDHAEKVSFKLSYRRGRLDSPKELSPDGDLVEFLEESEESVVLLERKKSPFLELLLDSNSASGVALPLVTERSLLGVLVVNSREERFYGRARLQFLDSLARIAAGVLNNAQLYRELQDHARQIEELQRYQENVFSSMTNLLVTTDESGRVHYFNRAAAERFALDEARVGRTLRDIFGKGLTKDVFKTIDTVEQNGQTVLGLEGIYKTDEIDIDYSLNIAPLQGKRGRHEGLTLIFTDQTAESRLKQEMKVVSEERRLIKDMFSSYLSEDIVKLLVENPDLVKPGGGARNATVFFADIAGYTNFSEGKDPASIVKILNEFFEEAEPIIRKHRGYLDKYIGDCIMAVFGVPVDAGEEDTVHAVTCALELQTLVNSPRRTFFRGEAEHLRIQIGMHTGPVVAGNLGGSRRMDFTEIGDTVNVAARLEGVAVAGEIIITENTRLHLGNRFKLDERKPVEVKGKKKPIKIFNVIGIDKQSA